MAAVHIDRIDRIEISNGVVCVSVVSEEDVIKWKMPLVVFRMGVHLADRTLAAHDAAGEVLPFKEPRKR